MIGRIKVYPNSSFVVNSLYPTHLYNCTENLLVGKTNRDTFQSLIQFELPEILEEAQIKVSLFLFLSKMSCKKFSLIIYPLWNKLKHNAISYYDFFYDSSKYVYVRLEKEKINKYLEIDISNFTLNLKETRSSSLGILLSSDEYCIADFGSAKSYNTGHCPYLLIQERNTCCKKEKIKILCEKIIPSEKGTFSKSIDTKFKTNVSFYVKNTSPLESIIVQIQTSINGQSYFNEGSPITVPKCSRMSLSSSVSSNKVRLVIYGTLVSDPTEVTSVFYNI